MVKKIGIIMQVNRKLNREDLTVVYEKRESFFYILDGIAILLGVFIFFLNGVGIFFKLINVLIYGGTIDYSNWLIVRAAEKSWPDLIFSFIGAIFILSIFRDGFSIGSNRLF